MIEKKNNYNIYIYIKAIDDDKEAVSVTHELMCKCRSREVRCLRADEMPVKYYRRERVTEK